MINMATKSSEMGLQVLPIFTTFLLIALGKNSRDQSWDDPQSRRSHERCKVQSINWLEGISAEHITGQKNI